MKDQKNKLTEMLRAEGMEGGLTLENAKKMKVLRENRAEVASLDLNNIIQKSARKGMRTSNSIRGGKK